MQNAIREIINGVDPNHIFDIFDSHFIIRERQRESGVE